MNAQTDRQTDIQKQMQKEYRTINGDKYIFRHYYIITGLVHYDKINLNYKNFVTHDWWSFKTSFTNLVP